MVSKRVRDMAASSALGGTELFYADNGSTDVKVTALQIRTFAGGGGAVSVVDFGATGDGVTDDTLSIQAAVDFALQNSIVNVYLPEGKYKTTDTIDLGYGYSFTTVVLVGPCRPGASQALGAWLLPTFVDRPIINIQGCRYSGVDSVGIQGPFGLGNPGFLGPIGSAISANYRPPGAQDTSRAPYCGVCIDGYSGSQPTTHYPLSAIPAFLGAGATQTYGRLNSSGAFVRNCSIRDTLVGIASCPNSSANGDFSDYSGNRLTNLKVGIAMGSINSRSSICRDINLFNVHTCFDAVTYALGTGLSSNGNLAGDYSNIHANGCYQLFLNDADWGQGWSVSDFYCEGMHKIGSTTGLSGSGPNFISGQFNFTEQYQDGGGFISEAKAEEIINSGTFINCRFIGLTSWFAFGDNCSFDGCQFLPYADFANSAAYDATANEEIAARRFMNVLMPLRGDAYTSTVPAGVPRFRNCLHYWNGSQLYSSYDTTGLKSWHSIGAVNTPAGGSPQYETVFKVPQFNRAAIVNLSSPVVSGRTLTTTDAFQSKASDLIFCPPFSGSASTWFYAESDGTVNGGNFDNVWTPLVNWTLAGNDGSSANLFSFSEEFDRGYWFNNVGATITPNTTLDPRGNVIADSYIESTTAGNNELGTGTTRIVGGTTYTYSREVKPGTRDSITLFMWDQDFDNDVHATFSLIGGGTVTGSGIGGAAVAGTPLITAIANGFYRCSVTGTFPSTANGAWNWMYVELGTAGAPRVNGNTSVIMGGAQLEAASSPGAYHAQTTTYTLTDASNYASRPSYYYPAGAINSIPRSDAFVVTKGSATVEYVDELGATKAIPANTVSVGKSWYHYGTNCLKHLKTYLAFPQSTSVSSVGANNFVMSNVALRSGVFPVCAGICDSIATEIESIVIPCSDEITALTTGTAKVTFRMPYAFKLTDIRASLSTAQTSGLIFTVDVNEAGTSIISTKLTIDNTEKTSTTAATPYVFSDQSLASDAEITVDIDQVGDGTAKGLKITLIGRQ